jgi:hypothetical protein
MVVENEEGDNSSSSFGQPDTKIGTTSGMKRLDVGVPRFGSIKSQDARIVQIDLTGSRSRLISYAGY